MGTSNRQQMIDNVHRFWIDGVLDNSLHGAVLMQLGLQSQPDSIHRPWDVKIRHDGEDRRLNDDTRIIDVFDYSGGTLLILGEPGSGKTTLLLELTRDLLHRAEVQPNDALPVVFNLSSWAKDELSLGTWLVEELNVKYQMARAVAQQWVADNAFLLLLDGLDEVAESARDKCVTEINAYRQQNPNVQVVVCSRTADYQMLAQKLDFHDAVVIDPLDDAQIDSYLASFGDTMDGLRQQMATDRRLRALAETPLTLSIMTLAYQELDTTTLPADTSLDAQRQHLLDTYIHTMFERHGKSKDQQPEDMMAYLSWLAGRMVERRQTLFHIENLQWDWLETRLQQSVYKLMSRTAYGTVIGGLAGGLALVVGVIMAAVIFGQDVQMYQGRNGNQYGLNALVLYAMFGSLAGILAGGIPFGLTGLLAFMGDRLSVKGQAKTYRARTAVVTVMISLLSSAIGGLLLALMMFVTSGELRNYGRHFYEFGENTDLMEGIEVLFWYMEISMLMGLVGGLVVVLMAGWWQRREGRSRQVMTGVTGLLVGGFYLLGAWFFFFSSGFDDLPDLFLPIVIFALFAGGIGILTGGFSDRIEAAERIGWRWSWRWAKVGTAVALVIVGLDYIATQSNYYSPSDPLSRALTMFIPIATLCILVGGVAGGLRKNETVDSRTEPNQGVKQSAITALKITGAFAIVGVIIGVISMAAVYGAEFVQSGFTISNMNEWELQRIAESFYGVLIVGLSTGLIAGLILGGTDTVIKHLVLRFMLWRNADIPTNMAKVLDHASTLILLRKVGGGYIFVHRYLLEHFAQIEDA